MQKVYQFVFRFWRSKRMQLFEKTLEPSADEIMIDVGGYPWFWCKREQKVKQIDCINLHEVKWDSNAYPHHRINVFVGDGCCLDSNDKAYDIAFSNSVIEHVGDWERQQSFASEIRRVGHKLWVQTPAYGCPVEPHYIGLFVHWLPVCVRRKLIRWVSLWGWLNRPDQSDIDESIAFTRLLTKRQMKRLFPDCQILTERLFFVFPKSYVAVRR